MRHRNLSIRLAALWIVLWTLTTLFFTDRRLEALFHAFDTAPPAVVSIVVILPPPDGAAVVKPESAGKLTGYSMTGFGAGTRRIGQILRKNGNEVFVQIPYSSHSQYAGGGLYRLPLMSEAPLQSGKVRIEDFLGSIRGSMGCLLAGQPGVKLKESLLTEIILQLKGSNTAVIDLSGEGRSTAEVLCARYRVGYLRCDVAANIREPGEGLGELIEKARRNGEALGVFSAEDVPWRHLDAILARFNRRLGKLGKSGVRLAPAGRLVRIPPPTIDLPVAEMM